MMRYDPYTKLSCAHGCGIVRNITLYYSMVFSKTGNGGIHSAKRLFPEL
jgi:hypothetical protein